MSVVEQHLRSVRELARAIDRPVKLMEVCGTHTVSAFRSGLRSLLPSSVSLLSGPGCPVCVTPNEYLDRAIAVAMQPDTTVVTFGDMLRVPGTEMSLEEARARGGRVSVVYSPLDALKSAEARPDSRTVFLGVGFETTAPAVAWTLKEAARRGVSGFSVLCAHKTIPNAMAALLKSGEVRVDGFLCPGHVSVITGSRVYEFICSGYHVPCVVAGFEAADMIIAIEMLLKQIRAGEARVELQYTRSVGESGNVEAQSVMAEVFEQCDTAWRGLGMIPRSGLKIRERFAAHDAGRIFAGLDVSRSKEHPGCICGAVLRGRNIPPDCPLFGTACTPSTPVGACMVSSEGTCAAYLKYAARGAGGPATEGTSRS